MHLQTILKKIGLNEKEAIIYLALLELKEGAPSSVAKKTGLKRPTTYIVLNTLEEKGVVSHFTKKGMLFYRATDPRLILEEEKNKVKQLEEAIPELSTLQNRFEIAPQMSVYQGKNGLIKIMEDTLTTKGELLCWCDVDLAVGTVLSDYFPYYLKKKIERKIWLRGIFSYNKGGLVHKKKEAEELREVYLIPKSKFPFKNEINIYDDKVAIISHQDEVGVIIQNQNIADTQRSIFELAFEYAKTLEKKILTEEDRKFLNHKP